MRPAGTTSVAELAEDAEHRLRAVSATPVVEARWIVEEVVGVDGVLATPERDRAVTRREMAMFDAMVGRRLTGEPLQYVLGHWSFRSLDLAVDRRALIPRPETEVVVEVALSLLDDGPGLGGGRSRRVLDMGSGTGAIALSVAVERPGTLVWAVEASEGAAQLTRENCSGIGRHGANVTVITSDWFESVPNELRGVCDLVVSNPPYVGPDDLLPPEVARWEPLDALIAEESGRADLLLLVAESPSWLGPGGALCLEIDPSHADDLRSAMADAGFERIEVHRDLTGRDRCVTGRRPV